MKLVTEPRIVLASRPVIEIKGFLEFLKEHGIEWPGLQKKLDSNVDLADDDGEWIVEAAARLCYMSYNKKGREHEIHLQHLIEVGHGSCLEHANYGFIIWNISRSLSHELVRHRAGVAYSQLSQRYVDESDTDFVVPPAIQELKASDPETYNEWVASIEQCRFTYGKITEALTRRYAVIPDVTERRKKARQAARSVLPNATETKMFVTLNARAVRHIIEMRASAPAEVEIRKLAVEMFRIMKLVAPILTYDQRVITLPDGTEGVESDHTKV